MAEERGQVPKVMGDDTLGEGKRSENARGPWWEGVKSRNGRGQTATLPGLRVGEQFCRDEEEKRGRPAETRDER